MNINNPVLVVVDVQNGFVNDHSRHVIPRIVSLIGQCEALGITIVLTKFINHENSPFQRLIGWSNVSKEPEIDLYETISFLDALVIEKYVYTAFTDEFLRLADSNGWETIIVCGISTESCVLKTAVDAFEKGFRPVVITDGCASNLGADMHANGLDILKVLIGANQLATAEQFVAAIEA